MPLYADIVLPLAQPAYTFAVPEGMHVAEGTAVAVQFGPRKFYTGVVWRVHDRRPPFRTIKSIQRVLYDAPLLSAQQKALWEWIAAYYMCSAGEVMRVALPSLMKPSGDTEEEFAEDEFRPRTETYLRLNRSQGGEFVVGVRSSIFLPLKHLQLIIVDEEHDASYKQADPAPRYNARDCAVVMARLWGGRTLLGSATPSLETWLNAEGGKYGRAVLAERYGDARPPEIFVSDTIRAAKRGERHAHFNKLLLDKMEETLGRGEQVMLFQNRRGFSPYVECSQCGWTARCPHCNVTLTYHKGGARLVCHYCGYTAPVPAKCPSCEVTEVLPRGFGTEKVEEEIARLFPEARVARLDRDSVTSERAFNAIISDFEARKTDILVGTQMITKGFDFGGVSLVGILNADNLLNNPDFRAAERAFQLMLQVAGRAGRRSDGGEVVIQTSEPGHPVIRQVVAGDFAGMARMQLSERKAFFYPPYARLTSLTLRHRDVALLRRGVTELAARLRVRFGRRVLGPMTPPVDRIRGEYLAGLLLKIESGASSAKARALLAAELKAFAENPEFKTITFICNVDPQ